MLSTKVLVKSFNKKKKKSGIGDVTEEDLLFQKYW